MKVHVRILYLMGVLVLILTAALYWQKEAERQLLEGLGYQELLEREKLFDHILELKGRPLRLLAYDYTSWDELISFIEKPDPQWAQTNLNPGLDTFQGDVLWVFGPEFERRYTYNRLNDRSFDDVIDRTIIEKRFPNELFCHFFIKTPSGLMEIWGASAHPSEDIKRSGKPKGYFFVGRLWSQEYIHRVSISTNTRVHIDYPGRQSPPKPHTRIGEISFVRPLTDVHGKGLASLHIIIFSNPVVFSSNMLGKGAVLLGAFSMVFLLVLYLLLEVWISKPLKSISMTLKTQDSRYIKDVTNDKTEFGDIARLIDFTFKQKDDLFVQISERKAAQEKLSRAYEGLTSLQSKLVQSEKMASVGQLAAGVAHEINNPVGFVINNVEVLEQYMRDYSHMLQIVKDLRKGVKDNDTLKIKSSLDRISDLEKTTDFDFINDDVGRLIISTKDGLERVRKIVMDLRTFSHRSNSDRETTKVESIIENILNIVTSEIKYKAELKKEFNDTPLVKCDPQGIGQVLINLILNAAQAIEDKGVITIRTYRDDRWVCVDVEDTGKGIPQEHLSKIFDPFFTTKPVGQGTGLGLSVSYEIIQKHQGELKVRSTPGAGATFTIKLPMVDI